MEELSASDDYSLYKMRDAKVKEGFFSKNLSLGFLGENLLPENGEAYLMKSFFSAEAADTLFRGIIETTSWRQDPIKIFGRSLLQPRLTAWMGDLGASYQYSGLSMTPTPWSPQLCEVKTTVEDRLQTTFNSALINYYRNGMDSMGWHRDNEPELGSAPVIASVSLGDSRLFKIRHYFNKVLRIDLNLEHGDLLVMAGQMQAYWEHGVPKTRKPKQARINITLRAVDIRQGQV